MNWLRFFCRHRQLLRERIAGELYLVCACGFKVPAIRKYPKSVDGKVAR